MNRLPAPEESSNRVRLGKLPESRRSLGGLGLGGLMGAIALNPWGDMLFGAIGVTAADPAWGLVQLLAALLALSALRLLESWPIQLSGIPTRFAQGGIQLCGWLSRAASGALLGFGYGGRWAGDDPRGAIAGALVGSGLALGLGWWGTRRCPSLERMAGGAIALLSAYCLWFWLGAWSLAAVMASHWLPGLGYGLIALLMGSLAWQGLLGLGAAKAS